MVIKKIVDVINSKQKDGEADIVSRDPATPPSVWQSRTLEKRLKGAEKALEAKAAALRAYKNAEVAQAEVLRVEAENDTKALEVEIALIKAQAEVSRAEEIGNLQGDISVAKLQKELEGLRGGSEKKKEQKPNKVDRVVKEAQEGLDVGRRLDEEMNKNIEFVYNKAREREIRKGVDVTSSAFDIQHKLTDEELHEVENIIDHFNKMKAQYS